MKQPHGPKFGDFNNQRVTPISAAYEGNNTFIAHRGGLHNAGIAVDNCGDLIAFCPHWPDHIDTLRHPWRPPRLVPELAFAIDHPRSVSHPFATVDRVPSEPDSSRLLTGLNPAQHEAVVNEADLLCILAGAGSGKTRVLTRRIAYRVATGRAEARHVLAVTFTRRSADELGRRLGGLGIRERVAAGTFHGLAFTQLRRWWAEREQQPLALLDRKTQIIGTLLSGRSATAQPKDVAAEIEWAKARMISPEAYAAAAATAQRRPPLSLAMMTWIYSAYEREKRTRRVIDFDDLLSLCLATMQDDAEFAAAQRWRFRHLFVDEYQDVNPLQAKLLSAWRGDRPDLCVVGDPNQAIYAWNGADPEELTGFAKRHPSAVVVDLRDNYRSTPQILALANAVLNSKPGGNTQLLRSNQPDGPIPTVRSYPTDTDEAFAIAQALRRRAPGGWSSMAVLTRTHAQLLLLEEALRSAAIPYRLRGAAPLLAQPRIKLALAELTSTPSTPLSNALTDLRQQLDDLSAETGEQAETNRGLIGHLVRLGAEHLATDPTATSASFTVWLRTALRGEESDARPGGAAVELATFHSAKGLEWPIVFLTGLEAGLMPIGHAETQVARDEERRLLYVAATRARRELHCSWAEQRTVGHRTLSRTPSPYLGPLEAVIKALTAGDSGGDWRRFLDESRDQMALGSNWSHRAKTTRPAPADPQMLDALRSWRASTARASGVPAFVVLHDTTLAAMAEAKPRNHAALLALPGIGPVKAERYGQAILAVVATVAS